MRINLWFLGLIRGVLSQADTVSITNLPVVTSLGSCGINCLWDGRDAFDQGPVAALGCNGSPIVYNSCYCREDKFTVALSAVSLCMERCVSEGGHLSVATSIYSSYCKNVLLNEPPATTTTGNPSTATQAGVTGQGNQDPSPRDRGLLHF
jgi:hypothetical protein